MTAGAIISAVGLEYIDTVFQTIQSSEFSQYTIVGMKTLAVLFFLVNILKKYNEGVAEKDGYTWGLSPGELAKNFAVVLLVIFSTQILGFFDGILVAIENQYRETAPALLPLQMQEIPIEEDVSALDAMRKAMALLYEALVTPLYGFKTFAFLISLFLWILDLFIYPLFLAERYFILGIMQAFFPLILSLSVFEKFRSMAYSFFSDYMREYICLFLLFFWSMYLLTRSIRRSIPTSGRTFSEPISGVISLLRWWNWDQLVLSSF